MNFRWDQWSFYPRNGHRLWEPEHPVKKALLEKAGGVLLSKVTHIRDLKEESLFETEGALHQRNPHGRRDSCPGSCEDSYGGR